jgi:organic hydroperoxide reductase OsmC/OhrA
MSEHTITLNWKRTTPDFNYKTYERTHTINFSGGSHIQVTAAPEYLGDPKITNPEELLVAALSSCHMLTFLALAAYKGLIIDNYNDEAIGVVGKNAAGKMAVTQVTLRPKITFSGNQPDAQVLHEIHEKAHVNCFIANSVNTEVKVEPR